uniref:Uncharacterized protein n=1 Tax=Nelumbo nucifera TaxID=4432 RepID=A0A822XTU9_NELNU|nr:TPA_asm: hypothetical protein HUJ06_024064 [Nelumbo nucifera]
MSMKDDLPGKGGGFSIDPNLPRWVCQNCWYALCIISVDSYADKFFNYPFSRSG